MQVLPLIGGSYSARSVVANGQRCINLYPEPNRADSPDKMTHYQRPGLSPLVVPASPGAARMLYQASNGDGYAVIGQNLYYISPSWVLYPLGSLGDTATTPCSMVDNGVDAILVNGVPYAGNAAGYVDFAANPLAAATVTLNGVVFTFIAGASSGASVHIGGTTAVTIQNLLTQVAAVGGASLTVAYYTAYTSGANVRFWVTYKTPGAIGTLYTLAASFATPSAATLALGNVQQGNGWTLALGDLTNPAITAIADAEFFGADRVDYIDTFIIFNTPGTNQFQSTTTGTILPLDGTYIADKTGWPDQIKTLIINKQEIYLVGALKSEVWYNAGGSTFPFARLPGTYIEHGIVARWSVASADINTYWLSNDFAGQSIVLRTRGHETKRISNYALEYAMSQMSDVTDAVAYCFQKSGHLFYVLSFPTANQTWVWDESIGDEELGWSQRCWTDTNGTLNRDRGAFGAFLYGKNVCLDWENGTLYEQSFSTYTDTVGTTTPQAYPITYLRTFPHLMFGTDSKSGQLILSNGHMVQHERFAINAELGNADPGITPEFSLRWSDDRGKSWGQPVTLLAGKQGEFGTRNDVRLLGQAMDRVYELSWTFAGQVAISGAWVEGKVLNQ